MNTSSSSCLVVERPRPWHFLVCCRPGHPPSENSSKRTEKAPSMGAHATSSMGRTVSPSVASKNIAPLAFSLHVRSTSQNKTAALHENSRPDHVRLHIDRGNQHQGVHVQWLWHSPEIVMGAPDGLLAGLIGGCSSAAGNQVQDGVHPAASLCSICCDQSLSIRVLLHSISPHLLQLPWQQSNRKEGLAAEAANALGCDCTFIFISLLRMRS